jgi:hypothetical protein
MLSEDTSALLPSVFELQNCVSFQIYVQDNLVPGIVNCVKDFVHLFIQMIGDSTLNSPDDVSKNHDFSRFSTLLQKLSSQVVSQFLQSLCKKNFDFVCFVARSTLEHFQASQDTPSVHAHVMLSPICIALRDMFDLDEDTTLRLGSIVMKCRVFAAQSCSRLSIISEAMLLRLSSSATMRPLPFDAIHVIKNIKALTLVAALNCHSIMKSALMFELQQAIHMHDRSIHDAFSLQNDVTAVLWRVVSADASFIKLSAEQLARAFVLIVEDMKECFLIYKMDVVRCSEVVSLVLSCTLVTILLNSKNDDFLLSAAHVTKIFESIPDFCRWFSMYVNQLVIDKYLELVPLSLFRGDIMYVRCAANSANSAAGSVANEPDSIPQHAVVCRSEAELRAQFKFEELLWSMVSHHQPLSADSITLSLLQKFTVTELQKDLDCSSSLKRRIKHISKFPPGVPDIDQQNASSAGGGAAATSTNPDKVVDVPLKTGLAPPSQHSSLVGSSCDVCRLSCGRSFYQAQARTASATSGAAAASALSSTKGPAAASHMCLRCVFEEFLPKDLLCNLKLSSIMSAMFMQPIFQKACLQSFSDSLLHCRIVLKNGIGSPAVFGAVVTDIDSPPQVAGIPIATVAKFDTHSSALIPSNSLRTVVRPTSNGCYPAAIALPTANHCSFQVVLDTEPTGNSITFGIALKNFPISDSKGVGPAIDSWGVMCSFPNEKTKFYSSGTKEQDECRALRKGDRLKAVVNFEQNQFIFTLNDTEVTHTFTMQNKLTYSDYVFAITCATQAQLTVCDHVHIIEQAFVSSGLDVSTSIDNSYAWMQSMTQEVTHMMCHFTLDSSSLATWFDQAMSAAAKIISPNSENSPTSPSSLPSAHVPSALLFNRSGFTANSLFFISGSTCSACNINGPYQRSGETVDGYPVYIKIDDSSMCISHITGSSSTKMWQIKATIDTSRDHCYAWVNGGGAFEACSSGSWKEIEKGSFLSQPGLKVMAGIQAEDAVSGTCLSCHANAQLTAQTRDSKLQLSSPHHADSILESLLFVSVCFMTHPLFQAAAHLDALARVIAEDNSQSTTISITGASGSNAAAINGLYMPIRAKKGYVRTVYNKIGDDSICIEYLRGPNAWEVKNVSDKGKDICVAFVKGDCALEACHASVWKVKDAGKFVEQGSVQMATGAEAEAAVSCSRCRVQRTNSMI